MTKEEFDASLLELLPGQVKTLEQDKARQAEELKQFIAAKNVLG